MPWKKGRAVSFEDLIAQTVAYVTDKKQHGKQAWQLMRSEPWPRGTIFKAPGLKGEDHLYIGLMALDVVKGVTYRKWFLTKETLSQHFVWSPRGANDRRPFNLTGSGFQMKQLYSGMRTHSTVTGGSAIWSRALADAGYPELRAYAVQGRPRSFNGQELVVVFGAAYPKQMTEKKAYKRALEAALATANEELNKVPWTPVKLKCLLECPYEEEYHESENAVYTFGSPAPEIFSHSAKVLYFGVFKQYQPKLDWHEQPGGLYFGDNLPLMTIGYKRSIPGSTPPYNPTYWTPPLMPGAGYPAIGMDPSGPLTGKFDYYLVKNRCGLTVAVNNFDKVGFGNWEAAYAGLFEPYTDYEYPFPACIMGGTTGLTMQGESRYFHGDPDPHPYLGLRFDYRPKNWSLIHGVASFAAAGADVDGCPTQVAAMRPDGTWQTFANYVQGARAVDHGYKNGNKYHPVYDYPYTAPVRPNQLQGFLRPTERDLNDYYNTYFPNADENRRSAAYLLQPIELVESRNKPRAAHHILGRLPEMFHLSRPIYRYGELKMNGTKYLVLPNVWERRKFHLPHQDPKAGVYSPDALLAEDLAREAEYRKTGDLMNLAIRMED